MNTTGGEDPCKVGSVYCRLLLNRMPDTRSTSIGLPRNERFHGNVRVDVQGEMGYVMFPAFYGEQGNKREPAGTRKCATRMGRESQPAGAEASVLLCSLDVMIREEDGFVQIRPCGKLARDKDRQRKA